MPEDVMESAATETALPDITPEISTESVPPETEGVVEPKAQEPETQPEQQETEDGRSIPQAYRELFKKDSKLRGIYFSERAYREHFPEGPTAAKEFREVIDEFVNSQGVDNFEDAVQSLRQQIETSDEMDSLYQKGDPALLDKMIEFDKEGFSKLIPVALERLAQVDKPTYDYALSRIVVETIRQPLAEAWNALNGNETTKEQAAKLAQWFNSLEQISAKQPERTVSPEAEKLAKERKEFESQKQQEFFKGVESKMREGNASLIEKNLAKEFRRVGRDVISERKADPEGYEVISRNCNEAISRVLAGDTEFNRRFAALIASGDGERAIRLARNKIDSIGPAAIQKTFALFNRTFGGKPKPANGQQQTQIKPKEAGTTQLSRVPKDNEIDWTRMRIYHSKHGYRDEGEMALSGKYYLKGQKELATL